jgi:hypothetical protein
MAIGAMPHEIFFRDDGAGLCADAVPINPQTTETINSAYAPRRFGWCPEMSGRANVMR